MPDLDTAGATIPLPTQVRGRTIFGYNPGTGQLVPVQVDGTGAVATFGGGGGGVTALGPTPAPTALPGLAVTPLPVAPPAAQFMIIQNRGPAGSLILVRELGGILGAGILLQRFGVLVLDGSYALEVQNTLAAASTAQITWET
jgi:hypothetical protein